MSSLFLSIDTKNFTKYISESLRKDGGKGASFHISADDLERCDMGCLKNLLLKYLKSCHVDEFIENNFKSPEENSTSGKEAIENNFPPEIPPRQKVDAITIPHIQH